MNKKYSFGRHRIEKSKYATIVKVPL